MNIAPQRQTDKITHEPQRGQLLLRKALNKCWVYNNFEYSNWINGNGALKEFSQQREQDKVYNRPKDILFNEN